MVNRLMFNTITYIGEEVNKITKDGAEPYLSSALFNIIYIMRTCGWD